MVSPGAETDRAFTQLLTAFATSQPVGFRVKASEYIASTGVPFCTLDKLYFYRPECDGTTAVCE